MTKKTEYRAPALEKGLEILELLAIQEEPLTKKQIADKMNRSLSEIFRMLSVLVEKQYIAYHSESSGYFLTLKMFGLSNQHPPVALLLKQSRPLMEQLCRKVNQSCHLSRYSHGQLMVIAREESPYKMGFSLKVGSRLDIYASGSGIVLLTFCEPDEWEAIIQHECATPEQIEQVTHLLKTTRNQGYYLGESPQISGVTNISAPIFDALGHLLAVITVPYMTLNSQTVPHPVEDIGQTCEELVNVANRLSQHLA